MFEKPERAAYLGEMRSEVKHEHTDCGRSWYAVQIRPNAGELARRNLVRQGFETFLPLIERDQRVLGRFKTVKRPLFPGYLFTRFNSVDSNWRQIRGTLGVVRIVSFGSTLRPMPEGFVAELQRRCGPEGVLRPAIGIEPGTKVRVIKGPFSNFLAEVERLDDQGRVWLLFDFLGQASRLGCTIDSLLLEEPKK